MAKTSAQERQLTSRLWKKGSQDFTAKERKEIKAELITVIATTLASINVANRTTVSETRNPPKNSLVFIVKLNIVDGEEEIKAAKALMKAIDDTFNRDQLRCKTEVNIRLPKEPGKKK